VAGTGMGILLDLIRRRKLSLGGKHLVTPIWPCYEPLIAALTFASNNVGWEIRKRGRKK